MKVFVTGGNGFIGSRVVRRLCAGGHEVRCLVRATSDTSRIDDLRADEPTPGRWTRFEGDVRDAASLTEGMRGADGCIHLASVSSWDDIASDALESTVIDGTRHLLECAVAAGRVRTVYISSAIAIGATETPQVLDEQTPFNITDDRLRYAKAKHQAEALVAQFIAREGLEVVIVNPAEVYGPDDTGMVTAGNIRDMIKDWPALACTGGTAVTHVDDVADGIVSALEKGRVGERYILGGENLSVEDLVRLTLDIAGLKKPVVRIPNGPLRWTIHTMVALGLPTPVIPGVVDYATRFFFMDSSKAQRELGYAPRPARQVLEPVVDWLRSSGRV